MTINYGAFPGDVFLLFFGFVPDPNPHDAVPLFADLLDLATAAADGAPAAVRRARPGAAPSGRPAPGLSDAGAASSVPDAEQRAAAAAPETVAGRAADARDTAEASSATASLRGGAQAGAAAMAGPSSSVGAEETGGLLNTGSVMGGRPAQERLSVQQDAERLEAMLLERLPPGDYRRCVAVSVRSS